MSKPIYLDGQPDNLEAAALDALDWLRYVEHRQVAEAIRAVLAQELPIVAEACGWPEAEGVSG